MLALHRRVGNIPLAHRATLALRRLLS
jgi:hypothetical protein